MIYSMYCCCQSATGSDTLCNDAFNGAHQHGAHAGWKLWHQCLPCWLWTCVILRVPCNLMSSGQRWHGNTTFFYFLINVFNVDRPSASVLIKISLSFNELTSWTGAAHVTFCPLIITEHLPAAAQRKTTTAHLYILPSTKQLIHMTALTTENISTPECFHCG